MSAVLPPPGSAPLPSQPLPSQSLPSQPLPAQPQPLPAQPQPQPQPQPVPVPAGGAAVPVVNLANALTALRLLLVPVFTVVLFVDGGESPGWRIAAWAAFAVASFTDRVDGQIARSRGLVTNVGKVADPIADKALIGAALIGLSLLGELPWLVTVVVLVREVGVTLLRFVVIRHGVMPASRGGKWKTALQSLAIGMYILPLSGLLGTARAVMMAAAVVVTLVTGADYVIRAATLRQTSPRAAMKRDRRAARDSATDSAPTPEGPGAG